MNKVARLLLIVILMFLYGNGKAQVGINTQVPDTNSVLDIKSSTKGVKFPELADTALSKPPSTKSGYVVYQPQSKRFRFWNSRFWESLNPFNTDNSDNITAPKRLRVEGDSLTAPNATVKANNFIGYGTIPLGGIIMWSGNVTQLPDGWALCDGTVHNGLPTPDLRGRFIAGYSGSGDYLLGSKAGGGNTITLTIDNIPTHTHTEGTLSTNIAGNHNHKHRGFKYVRDGDNEEAQARENIPSDPSDYGGEMAGNHSHDIFGSTGKTGGYYTYQQEIPNPPRIIPGCTVWQYSCITSSGVINSTYDLTTLPSLPPSLIAIGSPQQLPFAPNYYGYKFCDGDYESCNYDGYIESNITTISTVSSCRVNSGYNPATPDCIDVRHDPNTPLGVMIKIGENWDVRPFDNRPPFYVLAFIMRIK